MFILSLKETIIVLLIIFLNQNQKIVIVLFMSILKIWNRLFVLGILLRLMQKKIKAVLRSAKKASVRMVSVKVKSVKKVSAKTKNVRMANVKAKNVKAKRYTH